MSIINNHIATNPKFDASIQNGLESSRTDASRKGNYRGETVRDVFGSLFPVAVVGRTALPHHRIHVGLLS